MRPLFVSVLYFFLKFLIFWFLFLTRVLSMTAIVVVEKGNWHST